MAKTITIFSRTPAGQTASSRGVEMASSIPVSNAIMPMGTAMNSPMPVEPLAGSRCVVTESLTRAKCVTLGW